MVIDPESSHALQTGRSIPAAYQASGFIPTSSHFHLTRLAQALDEKALEHPLGDFGGGCPGRCP